MTHKQMKKLAEQIYKCELIHSDESSSKEEKTKAENRIMQLSSQIMALKNGMDIMSEIDMMVQELLSK